MNIFGMKVNIKLMAIKEQMGIHGFFDPVKKLIVIDSKQNDKEKMETLVHETVHAISHRLSWRQAIPIELEETFCDQLAKAFTENFDMKLKKNLAKRNNS